MSQFLLHKLRQFVRDKKLVDLLVCNYVYEHVEDNTRRVMHYRNVFPQNRVFGWDQIGRFRPSQYLLMHSVIYRTQLLRENGKYYVTPFGAKLEVDGITGATVTSKAIARSVNSAVGYVTGADVVSSATTWGG